MRADPFSEFAVALRGNFVRYLLALQQLLEVHMVGMPGQGDAGVGEDADDAGEQGGFGVLRHGFGFVGGVAAFALERGGRVDGPGPGGKGFEQPRIGLRQLVGPAGLRSLGRRRYLVGGEDLDLVEGFSGVLDAFEEGVDPGAFPTVGLLVLGPVEAGGDEQVVAGAAEGDVEQPVLLVAFPLALTPFELFVVLVALHGVAAGKGLDVERLAAVAELRAGVEDGHDRGLPALGSVDGHDLDGVAGAGGERALLGVVGLQGLQQVKDLRVGLRSTQAGDDVVHVLPLLGIEQVVVARSPEHRFAGEPHEAVFGREGRRPLADPQQPFVDLGCDALEAGQRIVGGQHAGGGLGVQHGEGAG